MLFLSTFVNKIDSKGRVSVPANFRMALSNSQFNGIIAYNSFINESIEACGIERIQKLSASIDNLDPYSDERDAFATSILGGCVQIPFDSEGRITFPKELLEKSLITDKAVFIGKGATFEIWQPEKFEIYSKCAREIAHKERAKLRLTPNGTSL